MHAQRPAPIGVWLERYRIVVVLRGFGIDGEGDGLAQVAASFHPVRGDIARKLVSFIDHLLRKILTNAGIGQQAIDINAGRGHCAEVFKDGARQRFEGIDPVV